MLASTRIQSPWNALRGLALLAWTALFAVVVPVDAHAANDLDRWLDVEVGQSTVFSDPRPIGRVLTRPMGRGSVSYTHLTLPTIYSV